MRTYTLTGDLGDCIYAMPVIRHLGGGVVKLKNEPSITRPLTQAMFDSLAGIMKPQPYIEDVVWADGTRVDYDFTLFRSHYRPLRTLAMSQARYLKVDRHFDTATPWLKPPRVVGHGYPIFARSARYHNPYWDRIWPEIVAMHKDAWFIGLESEHAAFCAEFGHVRRFPTRDFTDVAALIAGSSVFVGNQSAPYAIAEAMKVNTIQETHLNQRDCIFPRKNAVFVATYDEWVAIRDGRPREGTLVLALQFHPATIAQAEALLQLICDIEPTKRKDVEFCLSARRDVSTDDIDRLQRIAETKFATAHRILGRRAGTGWPAGPNDMWAETTTRMSIMRREGKTNAVAMLTFEPDCVPLRADWINVLKEAWYDADGHGKDVCGHQDTEKDHINGNGIFRIGIQVKHNALYGAGGEEGWDCAHGKLLLAIGEDTPAISQRYQWSNYTFDDLLSIRKHGQVPALFHGTKGDNGVRFVRLMLESGELARRSV